MGDAACKRLHDALAEAVRGLEWWVSTYPEYASEADNEKLDEWRKVLEEVGHG